MNWFLNFTFQYMRPYTKKDLNRNLVLFNLMIKSNMANPSLGIGLEISIVTLFLLLHFLGKKKRKRKLKRMHILSFIVLLTMATQNFPPFHLNFLHKKGGLCLELTLCILPLVKMATNSIFLTHCNIPFVSWEPTWLSLTKHQSSFLLFMHKIIFSSVKFFGVGKC